ncbi:alpha-amylase family protein [Chelativorans sp. AA-79]|uniref:alpha-amylase family protein n=1 Tax=Chelativorans sp. AA-79 TaxID=3028735 RepID=UPI0023F8EB49|nr:alpha-amylase family protein [Chelativorans sp. AA-79]WEX08047.1 alpha-amylase family protein [Chelativorans sp. AA-79]
MDISRTSDVWWKNAVFYCLDVETFQDGNGDGIGDFVGLARQVDYLAGLGVTCLWLMPFYPSPNRDDGYDIIDYYSVDPLLGNMGEFVEFVRTARDRGMRVIADLVVNHTSKEHPWFKSARSDRNSPYRDWYIWSDEIPEGGPSDLVFPDKENSNWEWDEEAGQYYLHRFYKHQPDLNIANPKVREEIRRIVGFWLEIGLSGFRVDAVPFLLETSGIERPMEIAPHDWLRDLRSFLGRRRGDAVLLGEVNLEYEAVRRFFGDESGDELHMCLNFNLNQALALVREDAGALVHNLRAMPSLPADAAWANFIRNHDEWSLDKLTEAERQEVFRAFGPKEDMQLFGRGLRRRLPTMLNGNQARIRMAYSLAFALPGAPVLFYGEEIGMAENLEIPGRMSVRAPMQWTTGPNGGFSTAPPDELCRPVVESKRWGPPKVNVADQQRDGDSLLNWMEHLIRRRRETPEIVFGAWSLVPVPQAAILALRHDWGERSVLTIHNLSGKSHRISFNPGQVASHGLVDLFGDGSFAVEKDGTVTIEVGGYDYRWFRIPRTDADTPA